MKYKVGGWQLAVGRTFLVLASLFLLLSCKVKYGLKGMTIPPEAKTISVATFKLGSDGAGLMPPTEPQLLSQKLRDAVSSQTNLALIKQNGELRFEECKVTAYSNGPQAIGTGASNNP